VYRCHSVGRVVSRFINVGYEAKGRPEGRFEAGGGKSGKSIALGLG